MKVDELFGLKQKLNHAFGKIDESDIVDGAVFVYPSPMKNLMTGKTISSPVYLKIVDTQSDKARYVYVNKNGEMTYDPDPGGLDVAKLHSDPEKQALLRKKFGLPKKKLDYKSVIARFLNDNRAKRA